MEAQGARAEWASADDVREACRRIRVDPAKRWWRAKAILGEREVQNAQGAPTKQFLVKFVGYAKPEWASEVNPALLREWRKQQHAHLKNRSLPAIQRRIATQNCPRTSVQAVAEFQLKSLLVQAHRRLRARLHFSLNNPACTIGRHRVEAPMTLESFAYLFPTQLQALVKANKVDRLFSRNGYSFSFTPQAFKSRFEPFVHRWWAAAKQHQSVGAEINFKYAVTLNFKVTLSRDFTHDECYACTQQWTFQDILAGRVPHCASTELALCSTLSRLTMTFRTMGTRTSVS
jgi:hypothetical protein